MVAVWRIVKLALKNKHIIYNGWGNALICSFRSFDIWHRHQRPSFLNEEYGFYSQTAQKTIGKKIPSRKGKGLM